MEWMLELLLIVLLAATLFHAIRLERALGVLKRDRAALQTLVTSFNASTTQAESSIVRLREAADGAGRQIAAQIDTAMALKDDLSFLSERGDGLANRLDSAIRSARPLAGSPSPMSHSSMDVPRSPAFADADPPDMPRVRSQAERDLVQALRMAR